VVLLIQLSRWLDQQDVTPDDARGGEDKAMKVTTWIEGVPAWYKFIGALASVLVIGIGIGVRYQAATDDIGARLMEVDSLRIWASAHDSAAQAWRLIHTDSVAAPALARLSTLEGQMADSSQRLDVMAEQVRQLYCDRFPARCQPVPRSREEGDGQ